MQPLKNVELVRQAIIKRQVRALADIRGYISLTDGNIAAVDALRGETGNLLLAEITELVLKRLGHETVTSVEAKASHVRRNIAKLRGKGVAPSEA